MRLAAIGDPHGRSFWDIFWVLIFMYDQVIFMGDYLDSYEVSGATQLSNLQEIIRLKLSFPDQVVLLRGNHCYSYIDPTRFQCAGFDAHIMSEAAKLFDDNDDLFVDAVEYDGYLFTHAGVSMSWLDRYNGLYKHLPVVDQVNMITKVFPRSLEFAHNQGRHFSASGDDVTQSPIRIRPRSLLLNPAHPKQVIGHTQINLPTVRKNLDNEIVLTDCPDYYTIIHHGEVTYGKYITNI